MTMHSHSPLVRVFGLVVWLFASIGAINWGLDAMGYNLFNYPFFAVSYPGLVMPLKYVIGLAGVISLLMMIDALLRGHGCGSAKCTC